jgi:hypothetical protein
MKVGVTGHQNIPQAAMEYIEHGMTLTLGRDKEEIVGVCSLAAGADQVFAEIILEQGGRLHVIVPSAGYNETFSRSEDLARFQSLLSRATTVETLSFDEPSEEAFLAAGCRMVELSDLVLAIWDGLPARGKGGTGDVVQYARAQNKTVEVIWPAGLSRH